MTGRSGADCEAEARAAHASGNYATALDCYERAYAAYRDEGDFPAAARAARTVGWFRGWVFGDWSVHRGWLSRARALLEQSDGAGRGWVVLDDALNGTDLDLQRGLYAEAIALARATNDRDLECDATASLGMMLIFSGLVDEGMAHLDGALAAICAGDVDELPVLEGCLCGLLTACEHTRDVGRAEEWLRSAEPVMRRDNLVAVAGYCRAHYGGILISAGRYSDAEDELAAALDQLPGDSSVRIAALCRLADLRIRQGRHEDADALLEGADQHDDATHPRVALHLARGEPDLALELLERVLAGGPLEDHVAGPLLSRAVEARLALGDIRGATESADALDDLLQRSRSHFMSGLAAAARGRVAAASGDSDPRAWWHRAVSAFGAAKMPVDAAAARLEVARLAAEERPAVAVAEARTALLALDTAGDRLADAATALLRSLGATPPPGPKLRATLTKREDEVLGLLGHGLTNQEIGERLFISAKTVEHHVGRVLAKLNLRSRTEAAAFVLRV